MTRLRTFGPQKGKRYYVISTTGGLIDPACITGGLRHSTSYSILDSYWGHREAAQFYRRARNGVSGARLAAQAAAECVRLNADEAEWEREVLAS